MLMRKNLARSVVEPEAWSVPAWRWKRLLVRPLSFVGPAENPAALYFRLRGSGRRGWGDFSQRRRRRHREAVALHRVDQLAVRCPADRRAIVGADIGVLWR